MDINRGNMNALFTGYNMSFQEGQQLADQAYKRFATVMPSTHSSEIFPFLDRFGGMREWIGDRQMKSVASHKKTVVNRKFEDSVKVKRDDIEDDTYGLYNSMLQDLGLNAEDLWRELAEEALSGGFDDDWIDELDFFSDTRKYGEYSITNIGSAALSDTALTSVVTAMLQYRGHNGKFLNLRPDLLIVGPQNRGTAFDILKNDLIIKTKGAATGVIKNQYAMEGTIDYQVVNSLGAEWFVTCTNRPLKAVGVLQRVLAKLTRQDRDEDAGVYERDEYSYGTRARGAGFLTLPHLIYANDPS
ncbi:MAG: Mu-like prophage major head subunit gpT family protein [Kiritimatiellae bacterium]|nr:Mu-like prophage major head subunit gpT family protein [Kiritimatiellia bacterium]